MHHAGHPDVADIDGAGKDLVGDVAARERLADDLQLVGRFRLGLAVGGKRVADLAVPVELGAEIAAADELAIADALRRIVLGRDDAVADGELVRRHVELLRRHLDEEAPRLGGGVAHLRAAELEAGAAAGAALIDGARGVAHHHRDPLERQVELVGDELRHRRHRRPAPCRSCRRRRWPSRPGARRYSCRAARGRAAAAPRARPWRRPWPPAGTAKATTSAPAPWSTPRRETGSNAVSVMVASLTPGPRA